MATSVSYAELIKMIPTDLATEIRENELSLQKMRVGITMGREKDTARYQRLRRQLARMKTALTAKTSQEALKPTVKASTMPAPQAKKETAKKTPSKPKKRVSASKA